MRSLHPLLLALDYTRRGSISIEPLSSTIEDLADHGGQIRFLRQQWQKHT